MKLLIAGSRSIKDFDLEPYIPNDTELIISGGAKGVDTLAEDYADKHNISKIILRPEYSKYGKAAPLKRNEKMIEMCDELLVIWDKKSRGSLFTIKHAQAKAKPVKIVTVE